MEFFAYFKNPKKGNFGTHEYPKVLFELREKYKKNLVDPTGGKEPLKYREFAEANAENIKKNSQYKLDYRKKKMLDINEASNMVISKPREMKLKGPFLIAKELDYNYDPNEEVLEKAL